MFASKVHGAARERLLSYLVPLYQEGYNCLLRCPSIQHELQIIIKRLLRVNTKETTEESEKCQVEVQTIVEVWINRPSFTDCTK